MINAKLLELLSSLSPKEAHRFLDFLASPYYNKSKQLLELANKLVKDICFASTPDTRHDLTEYTTGFPYAESRLLQLAHQFVIAESTQLDDYRSQLNLLSHFSLKGLQNNFKSKEAEIEKRMGTSLQKNDEYFRGVYRLRFIKAAHYARFRPRKKSPPSPQAIIQPLEIEFLLSKLRIACVSLSHRQIFGETLEMIDITPLEWEKIQLYLPDLDALRIYHYIYCLYHDGDLKTVVPVLDLLPKLKEVFERNEVIDLFVLIQNFLARKANQEAGAGLQLLTVLQWGFDNRIPPPLQMITAHLTKNYISLSIRFGQAARAVKILKENRQLLPEPLTNNLTHFLNASIHFQQAKYILAKQQIAQISYEDQFVELSTRILLAKIYFCEKEEETLLSSLQSLKMFVRTQHFLSAYHKLLYNHFILALTKAVRIRNKSDLSKVLTWIQGHAMTEKDWLIQNIAVHFPSWQVK